MPAYATSADLTAYLLDSGIAAPADPAAVTRLLERATGDIDAILGPIPVRTTGAYAGRKLDPTVLADWEAAALSNATCAQAEYRLHNPTAYRDRPTKSVSGPDFTTVYSDGGGTGAGVAGKTAGATGRYGPQVELELRPIRHLRRLTARMVS